MYFTNAGNWTEKKREGHDFQTTVHVLDDPNLRVLNEDLEMVFSFGEAKFDVIIPIERSQQHHPGLGRALSQSHSVLSQSRKDDRK
jgi:hypothetical protein